MINGENRFNPIFVKEFLQTLDEIEKEKSISSMVIFSGDARMFEESNLPDQDRLAKKDFKGIRHFYGLNDIFKKAPSLSHAL